jgi:hypothetical protein
MVVVCEKFVVCNLGLDHAESWLQSDKWYVEAAGPEGGVGGLLSVAEQLDVGATTSEISVLKASISCRVDDEVALDAGRHRFGGAPPRVDLFIYSVRS